MQKESNIFNLIAAGINSKISEKAILKGYTLSKLKATSKTELKKDFESFEIPNIIKATKRKPISTDVITKLISESDCKCCICWDIYKEEPVIVHHIIEHSKTKDDSYDNLVLLCLNHHALAHTNWNISRHPLSSEFIRQRKKEWIKAVSDFKNGLRPAPSNKIKLSKNFYQSDKEALKYFQSFIDRPAMHQPFKVEGNMADFLRAITDVILALNTGILKTREGDVIIRTKPRNMFSNPNWRQKLDIITSRFEELRTRFEIAVRGNEMTIHSDGFYSFHNLELPSEIDAMREAIILLFNKLMQEAELGLIRGIITKKHRRW